MKTILINGRTYKAKASHNGVPLGPANINPCQSVIDGKNGTVGGLSALAQALERGCQLIESGKANIDNSRRLLS